MLSSPGEISQAFEWSMLRFWGKIRFSVYLLHRYVIYTPTIRSQKHSEIVLVMALATLAVQSAHLQWTGNGV